MVNSIVDDSPYYHLRGFATTCNLVPSFEASDALNLDTCTRFDRPGDEPTAIFLYKVLERTKWGSITAKLLGRGLDCRPTEGMSMIAISTAGSAIYCKAFIGQVNKFGNITCTYHCNCRSGCMSFRLGIADPASKTICGFLV